jgi:hypothetical protein
LGVFFESAHIWGLKQFLQSDNPPKNSEVSQEGAAASQNAVGAPAESQADDLNNGAAVGASTNVVENNDVVENNNVNDENMLPGK